MFSNPVRGHDPHEEVPAPVPRSSYLFTGREWWEFRFLLQSIRIVGAGRCNGGKTQDRKSTEHRTADPSVVNSKQRGMPDAEEIAKR